MFSIRFLKTANLWCPMNNMSDTKEQTRQGYDRSATAYAERVADKHPSEVAARFCSLLPKRGNILDLGCGPGRDANIFASQGYSVVGIDFSPEMVDLARKACPQGSFHVMDIEQISFPKHSFDGVWASASLLHVSKVHLSRVLESINDVLKPEGAFYLSVKCGSGEGIESDTRYGGDIQKFWSYHDEETLRHHLTAAHFEVTECVVISENVDYEGHPIIRMLSKKVRNR